MSHLPYNLHEITLSKWVEWQNMYGQKLDDRFESIAKLEGENKRNAHLLHQFDEYCQKYSFYTGVKLQTLTKMPMDEILLIIKEVGQSEIALKRHESELNYNKTFYWSGDYWKIQPIVPHVAKFNQQQFEASQDIALIFSDLQDGKHEALYDLCAAYLRKLDEPYSEELMTGRVELMKSLPLSISLCVKNYIVYTIKELLKR